LDAHSAFVALIPALLVTRWRVRIYLPASLPLARSWAASHRIGPLPLTGFAITPGLREWYANADADELEYAATARAARASLRLIPVTEPRRVVVVVDVTDETYSVRDDLEEGAVQLGSSPSWQEVACALVDDLEAEAIVAAAIPLIDAADLGDEEAEFIVSETEDHELGWFATQEIPNL
jgi:hypothetical protein